MRKLLNPISISILVLLVWLICAISYAYYDEMKHAGGSGIEDIAWTILLTPYIAFLVFNTCLICYKSWFKINKSAAIAIDILLLMGIAATMIYFILL